MAFLGNLGPMNVGKVTELFCLVGALMIDLCVDWALNLMLGSSIVAQDSW